jgi:hypothetical protein
MSEIEEQRKLLKACEEMLAFHRDRGDGDGPAAQVALEKQRELEEQIDAAEEAPPESSGQ